MKRFSLLCCLLAIAGSVCADVKLPAIIGNNMVLQANDDLPIWGWAEPGEEITVTLVDHKKSTKAGVDGKWMVKLGSMKASATPIEMTVAGKNTIKLTNILVGEVWIGSGQSNMQMTVHSSQNFEEEIKNAKYPTVRLFQVPLVSKDKPATDVTASWVECSPETVSNFSAVLYFFGRELHTTLNLPLGLIHTSWGGTPAESWANRETLEANPDFKPIVERWDKAMADFPRAQKEYEEKLKQWEHDSAEAKKENKPQPRRPNGPWGPGHPWQPAGLYNAMIFPLAPYAIKGAIWYQGESNAGRAHQYRTLLPAMITDWHKLWNQGEFPFLIVSLANFMDTKAQPEESDWAELREAQTIAAQTVPNAGIALAIDIGDAKDIHPKNKQEVGRRLALNALYKTYKHKDLVYSGPTYDGFNVKHDKIVIKFKHTADGLEAKGGELKGFAIAGSDKKFVWAKAEIDGDKVVVSSPEVKEPVAVRYAWAANPDCNLYNKAGLPTNPFRTDDWPGVTVDKK